MAEHQPFHPQDQQQHDELAQQDELLQDPPSPAGSSSTTGGNTGRTVGGSNSGKKLQRPIIRSAQACSQCRSHKIRCVPGPDPEVPFPCSRCIAQNLHCEVLKHNRGRKRKQPPSESDQTEKRESSSFYGASETGGSLHSSVNNGGASLAPPSSATSAPGVKLPSQSRKGKSAASKSAAAKAGTSNFPSPDNGNLHMLEQAIALSGGVPAPISSTNAATSQQQQQQQQQPQSTGSSSNSNNTNKYFSSPRLPGMQPVYMSSPRPGEGPQHRNQQQSMQGHLSSSQSQQQHTPYPSVYQMPPPQQHQDYRPGQNIFSNTIPQQQQQPRSSSQTPQFASQGGSSMSSASFPPPQHMAQMPIPWPMMQGSSHPHPATSSQAGGGGDGMAPVPLTRPQGIQGQSSTKARGSPAQNRLSPSYPSATDTNAIKQEGSSEKAGPERTSTLEKLKFPFLIPRSGRTGRRGMFSLTALVPSEQVEEVGPGPAMANWSEQTLLANDPIQIGVLSLEDAKTLYQLYMEEMSTMNALLDPVIHTHDFVRNKSKFLYCAILSVISRYLNSTTYSADGTPKRLLSPVYVYCKKAATAHLRAVLGNIETSLEVIQGLTILTFHKDTEDEKACLNLYRAIAIAREVGLDQVRIVPDMSDDEKAWTRIKQRVWLSLFVANTILTMQFDMNVLIGPDDPAISSSSRFAIGSALPTDTLLCASVQLRRLYHIYSDMAKSLETIGETSADKAAKLISLSLLTRTANRELEQALRDWKEEAKAVGLVRIDSKLDIWVAAIKLKLNLTIVQMSLPGLRERATAISGSFLPPSKEPATGGPRGKASELGCINAFHHSIAAACQILQSMPAMAEKKLLSFAADTFLSFSIYAAFFLWTLCRDTGPTLLQEGEINHCFTLIESAARALESASLYPGDSPGLHGRFLRSLSLARSQHKKHNGAVVAEPAGSEDGRMDTSNSNPSAAPETSTPLGPDYVHPTLDALSRIQAPGAEAPPPPADPPANAAPSQGPGTAADIDSMLMADWNAMQKDFPWAFDQNGIPFLDGSQTQFAGSASAQQQQQQQPQFATPIQPAFAQLIPGTQEYDMSFIPRNGGSWP